MGENYLGNQLLRYIQLRGITQRDFAKLCHMNETTLSKYISGQRKPRADTIIIMAYQLGITSDELLGMNEYYQQEMLKEM